MPNKWFAGFLGFFAGSIAFIYLARWSLFWFYLVLGLVVALLVEGFKQYQALALLSVTLSLVISVHAYRLAKQVDVPLTRWYNRWYSALAIWAGFIVVVALPRLFIYDFFSIPAGSMAPTIQVGDYIITSKWRNGVYSIFGKPLLNWVDSHSPAPEIGSVITFYRPDTGVTYVKRLIAGPGDSLVFANKQLTINGQAVETELAADGLTARENLKGHSYRVQYINDKNPWRNYQVQVPEGAYVVLGDNRDNSADSRMWGFIKRAEILGKVVFIWH